MSFVFTPPPLVSVPVVGTLDRFPVHRVYCVGRNYEEHAKEMGFTGREPPFFFLKPADAVVVVALGADVEVLLQVGLVEHGLARGAFDPQPFRHRPAFGRVGGLDARGQKLFKPTHVFLLGFLTSGCRRQAL